MFRRGVSTETSITGKERLRKYPLAPEFIAGRYADNAAAFAGARCTNGSILKGDSSSRDSPACSKSATQSSLSPTGPDGDGARRAWQGSRSKGCGRSRQALRQGWNKAWAWRPPWLAPLLGDMRQHRGRRAKTEISSGSPVDSIALSGGGPVSDGARRRPVRSPRQSPPFLWRQSRPYQPRLYGGLCSRPVTTKRRLLPTRDAATGPIERPAVIFGAELGPGGRSWRCIRSAISSRFARS